MKDKDRLFGLGALVLGAAVVASGCSVLQQAAASSFEYKATLDTNGALVDCYTNTNPTATKEEGKLHVVFDQAVCFDETPDARRITGMSLSEPFSGEVTVDHIGVIERPLVATPQPSQ